MGIQQNKALMAIYLNKEIESKKIGEIIGVTNTAATNLCYNLYNRGLVRSRTVISPTRPFKKIIWFINPNNLPHALRKIKEIENNASIPKT